MESVVSRLGRDSHKDVALSSGSMSALFSGTQRAHDQVPRLALLM